MKSCFQRILSLVLCGVMLMGMLPAMLLTTGAEDNIASDNAVVRQAYDSAALASHKARAFTEGTPIGMRLHFGAPFTKFTICMPTWSDQNVSLTLSIYKWNTDFDTTREAPPLATRKIENHPDNGHAALEFDELPAGEYLICVDEFSGGRLGAWQMDPAVGNGFVYEQGMEKAADWEINVSFSKTPVQAFLPMESVMDTLYGDHTPPAESVTPDDALVNTHKVMPDTWVFTDGLGRTSYTYEDVGGPKEDKTVAMFYWTWHVDLAGNSPLNVNDFIQQYPEAQNDYDHKEWPTENVAYFWNEPIWGYYRTNDPWVLRRQAELLANAGVDTIFTDNTNGNYTWRSSYIPLYETWSDALENGAVNVPKVSYLLPFSSTEGNLEQLESLYLDIYRPGNYQNLWYYLDGKPMLMAHNDSVTGANATSNIKKEIGNFFTFRAGQADYIFNHKAPYGKWGWLSTYPQAVYYGTREDVTKKNIEQMSVGVAVNHNYLTHKITAMNGENVIGRSYSSTYPDRYAVEGANASLYGYGFSEQFDYAIEKDPKVIFITGWNEWTAGRHENWFNVENAFPDQFNDEFSRDIEPTKGDLKDHYYYLLVNYVRKYKGVNPIPTPSEKVSIDLGDIGAWKKVEPYYAAYIGNTDDRNAQGYGDLVYTETSGRNDIIGAQVARDDEFVYFHVECAEDITPYTDKLWMNLYIDAKGDGALDGWNSFDYVLNKTAPTATTAVLEKFTGDGYATEKVADVEYKVDGRTMTVKIAKSDLGLSGDDYTVNFAWTDNVHDEGNYDAYSGDIMDFYISGDVAPGGRFKYSFISTAENSGEAVETETETETEAPETVPETAPTTATPVDTTPETPAETGAETDAPDDGGCASTVGMSAALLLTLCGAAVALRRRKE